MRFTDENVSALIELRGVYDGWSVAALRDGTLVNRWADEEGKAVPGYERRWKLTQHFIDHQARTEPSE